MESAAMLRLIENAACWGVGKLDERVERVESWAAVQGFFFSVALSYNLFPRNCELLNCCLNWVSLASLLSCCSEKKKKKQVHQPHQSPVAPSPPTPAFVLRDLYEVGRHDNCSSTAGRGLCKRYISWSNKDFLPPSGSSACLKPWQWSYCVTESFIDPADWLHRCPRVLSDLAEMRAKDQVDLLHIHIDGHVFSLMSLFQRVWAIKMEDKPIYVIIFPVSCIMELLREQHALLGHTY